MPPAPEFGIDLLTARVQALYRTDAEGRLLHTNEWDARPAPRFHLMRTAHGAIVRFRGDTPAETVQALTALSRLERGGDGPWPEQHAAYLERLEADAPVERAWSGPAYALPGDRVVAAEAVAVDAGNAALLEAHFADWLADVAHRRPFVAVLDPAVAYRLQMATAGGVLIEDVDPVAFGAPAEASLAEVNAGLVAGKYVSPAKLAGWVGVAGALGFTPLNKAGDTASALNLIVAPAPAVNAAGFLGLPVVTLNASANLATTHNGRMVRHTDATAYAWTIPPSSAAGWVLNSAIALRNAGAGTITLTRGAGVVLRRGGAAADGNVMLAQWGFAFLTMEENDTWLVQGSGLA